MSTQLGTRRSIRETVPVAVILLFWGTLSAFPHEGIATGFRYAGLVMALLYVVVRGIGLAGTHAFTSHPDHLVELLRENGHVALLASVWFFAAFLVSATLPAWTAFSTMGTGYPGAVNVLVSIGNGALETLTFAFTWTGVATVLLSAIAVGLSRSHSRVFAPRNGGRSTVQQDD